MPLNLKNVYDCLQKFDFAQLFLNELGWNPPVNKRSLPINDTYTRHEIARIKDTPVFEVSSSNGTIPDRNMRDILHSEVSGLYHNSLFIFLNKDRTQSIWHWNWRDWDKQCRKEYMYFKGQPGDFFLHQFTALAITQKIYWEKLLNKPVQKNFASEYEKQYKNFLQYTNNITDNDNIDEKSYYIAILLNRLQFVYLLQKSGFLDNNTNYLSDHLTASHQKYTNHYYPYFLRPLFLDALSKPQEERTNSINILLGNVPFIAHDLFISLADDKDAVADNIPDEAFENLFNFFSHYTWSLVDIPESLDEVITPTVLGDLFILPDERNKTKVYAIPQAIAHYFCKQTIHRIIVEKINKGIALETRMKKTHHSLDDVFANLDADLCKRLLFQILPQLSILDPACGSGTFLVAALQTLSYTYGAILGIIEYLGDSELQNWLNENHLIYKNIEYELRKRIIADNLSGIDLSEGAVEKTRLQLVLSALTSITSKDELDLFTEGSTSHINIGNSLLILPDNQSNTIYQQDLFQTHKSSQVDLIITDPPWETLQPQDKQHNTLREHKHFLHQGNNSRYQTYKLFLEQCYNLLNEDGHCGIMLPSNFYSDYRAPQLRRFIFEKTTLTGLFSFENYKNILPGLNPQFKFALLTFKKDALTDIFPAAFKRHDTGELKYFPEENAVPISMNLLHKLSPDTLTVPEFRSSKDIEINKKMAHFPFLGEKVNDRWNLILKSDFHMTGARDLLQQTPEAGSLPLYEGKMLQQFADTHTLARYWINEQQGRKKLSGKSSERGQKLDYQQYRLGFRTIVASTNDRTMVATILPKSVFTNNTIATWIGLPVYEQLFLVAILNSFTTDFFLRLRVSLQLTNFAISQLPVPRLIKVDKDFLPIMQRAARLICVAPEFKELWEESMGSGWSLDAVATTFGHRARLRAELDGLIAHLYSLSEGEFIYLLKTFLYIPEPVRIAAQNAYRDVERGLIR